MAKKGKSAREVAYYALISFEKEKRRLDDIVDELLGKFSLDSRQRRFLKNLTSGVVRHLNYLDWFIARLYKGKLKKMFIKTRVLLRMALYEILFMEAIPARATLFEYGELTRRLIDRKTTGLVNGILREFLRQKEKLDPQKEITDPVERLSVVYSFPQWLIRRWIGFWGTEETEALCKKLNEPPRFDLRIVRKNISPQKFKALLKEKKIAFKESPLFPDMVTVWDVQAVINAGWLDKGYCVVQDESARLPVAALEPQPGETILDVCASPGGKFTQILEAVQPDGMAVALDVDLKRLKRVKQNANRLGLKGGLYVCADARHLPFKQSFDKILVDAPCSGQGVIRKHPDIKWRREFAELVEFSKLQQDILESAFNLLKPGGRLAYSTCTVDFLENENIVNELKEKKGRDFRMLNLSDRFPTFSAQGAIRTFPHQHDTDGSFCALIEKT